MKSKMVMMVVLIFVLGALAASSAAEPDIKGSKDHSLLSRMPDFHISSYTDTEFASHKFINEDKKPIVIEGHKYYIEYRLDKGAAEPGEIKIRRNIQDALKSIGGKVLFDDNFNKVTTIVLQKSGSFDFNMKLSKDRADAVAGALSAKHGIAAARLKAYGVSSLAPVASNDTEEGKAKNRRVELVKQ